MIIILVELCFCDLDIDVLKWTYFPLHSKQIQRWVAEGGFSWTFEKFLKVSKILERSGYQGSYNGNMMEDYIWSGGGRFVKVIYSISVNREKLLTLKIFVVSLVSS